MNSHSLVSRFKMPVKWAGLLVPFALILAACQSAAVQSPTPAATSAPVATVAPTSVSLPDTSSAEASINVATNPTLGQILVDGNGMTLYIYEKDGPNQSNCTGDCADAWPPLLTQGNPTLGQGVDASLLGTAARADGSMMVTYNKMPLYTWAGDKKSGDATGQGIKGIWFVVSPDGKPVGNGPAATSAPSASTSEATINVVTDPTLGQILVDGNGMTLYMFAKDGPDQSNCSGDCANAWPPLLTQGNPTLGQGVDDSLVGTATLADGSKMVTYNHLPLYTFAKDKKPGDTTGQGVGGVWYVVSPDGKEVDMEPEATSPPAAASAQGATINVATDPTLGQILVDGNGMTLYVFTKDGPNQSNCTGNCLDAWPPLLTQDNPALGAGVDASLVGTATLADGSKIVTYNKMPLYTFSKDKKAGDTTGQDVGGVWYVIAPDGNMVDIEPAATSAPETNAQEATINVVMDPTLGQILVDGNGMTLYIFTKDGPNQSNCTGSCLDAWPPLLTQGNPTLGAGVDASLVGNATLADGSKIVTYNQMPLYTFSQDKKPGDTTGQGARNVWFVVSPSGEAIGR